MTDGRPAQSGAPDAPRARDSQASEKSWWPRASLSDRIVQVAMAATAWIVVILAVHLQPSPAGLGTHEQLGFQPCAFYQMTGRPCPGCGLTTAFAHMAHGHLLQAAIVQPFGAVLFVLTVVTALAATVTSVWGRSWNLILLRINLPVCLYGLLFLGLASWIYKVVYGQMVGDYCP